MSAEYRVLVVGVAVIMIPADEGPERYKDLIDSILLSQLVADRKIQETPLTDWYSAYVRFMDQYWLRQVKSRQDRSVPQGAVEVMSAWAVDSLLAHGSDENGSMAAIVKRLVMLSGDQPALKILRRHMQRTIPDIVVEKPVAEGHTRLLMVVARTPTSFTSGYIEFKTAQILSPNPFSQCYEGGQVDGDVTLRHAEAKLSETRYGPVRAAIDAKIQDRRESHIALVAFDDAAQDIEALRLY
ncbi:hypothetical protein ACXR0M_20310 [Pseudomonas sp. Eth.TT006]